MLLCCVVSCVVDRQVSLNEKDWDTHVSFTVMSLAASPDGKYLLGATDKSRHGLYCTDLLTDCVIIYSFFVVSVYLFLLLL